MQFREEAAVRMQCLRHHPGGTVVLRLCHCVLLSPSHCCQIQHTRCHIYLRGAICTSYPDTPHASSSTNLLRKLVAHQVVSRNAIDQDKDLQQMLKDGIVRMCPSCKDPMMKDYGICNVIQCGQCSIWWNWKTRQTGSSSTELKLRARQAGVLWEPGG